MATPNYSVNYNDKRFTQVQADKKAALNEVDVTFGNMISQSDQYYQKQIDAAQDWADKQTQIQNDKTDFAIEQINQQKEQAKQDYTKEQAGAYVDWQKQSNQYGANAEQMASQGMTNTGYSESSQVSMYNTYQNRVATARESYQRAVLNYDNAIKDARLQNNAALAEIAYNALQKQLELSLQGFQYKNTIVIEKANQRRETENTYYSRYQDVLQQINTENALAENIRQFNEKMAEDRRQYNESLALQKEQLSEQKRQFNVKNTSYNSSGGSGSSGSKSSSGSSSKTSGSSKTIKNTSSSSSSEKTGSGSSGGGIFKSEGSSMNGSKPEVDMGSVLALGRGPISAEELNRLVQKGDVIEYVSGGKLKFKNSFNYQKLLKDLYQNG